VDLGGGKGKKTALAILDRCGSAVMVTRLAPRAKERPLYDEALVGTILSCAEGALVCVDAPLTLPPCLRCVEAVCPGQAACLDPEVVSMRALAPAAANQRDHRRGKPAITPYTQRLTEFHLQARGILARETLGQGMGPLSARAAYLVRALGQRFRLNHNLIEVSPRATLEVLGFREPYKKRADRRVEILASLGDLAFAPGVWREECRQSDHVFDAVVCAYTGYLACRDGWLHPAPGDVRGWIYVPPEPTGIRADAPANEKKDSAQPTAKQPRSVR